MLLIISYLVAVNECLSELSSINVVLRLMELMLSLCGGVGWVGGWGRVCTVIFVSTPSPTDLDWTVRLDWSLTIIFKFQSNFTNNAACLFGCTSFLQFI